MYVVYDSLFYFQPSKRVSMISQKLKIKKYINLFRNKVAERSDGVFYLLAIQHLLKVQRNQQAV